MSGGSERFHAPYATRQIRVSFAFKFKFATGFVYFNKIIQYVYTVIQSSKLKQKQPLKTRFCNKTFIKIKNLFKNGLKHMVYGMV